MDRTRGIPKTTSLSLHSVRKVCLTIFLSPSSLILCWSWRWCSRTCQKLCLGEVGSLVEARL